MTGRRFSAVVRDAATSAKSISRSRSRANFDTVKSVSNGQIRDRDALQIPRAYKDTMKVAHMRERLLADARRYSPISLVLNLQKLPQTIFSRLIFFPIVWILMLTYAAVAVLTRMGYIDIAAYVGDSEEGLDHMGSASVLVTFVVVFRFCASGLVRFRFRQSRGALFRINQENCPGGLRPPPRPKTLF